MGNFRGAAEPQLTRQDCVVCSSARQGTTAVSNDCRHTSSRGLCSCICQQPMPQLQTSCGRSARSLQPIPGPAPQAARPVPTPRPLPPRARAPGNLPAPPRAAWRPAARRCPGPPAAAAAAGRPAPALPPQAPPLPLKAARQAPGVLGAAEHRSGSWPRRQPPPLPWPPPLLTDRPSTPAAAAAECPPALLPLAPPLLLTVPLPLPKLLAQPAWRQRLVWACPRAWQRRPLPKQPTVLLAPAAAA